MIFLTGSSSRVYYRMKFDGAFPREWFIEKLPGYQGNCKFLVNIFSSFFFEIHHEIFLRQIINLQFMFNSIYLQVKSL